MSFNAILPVIRSVVISPAAWALYLVIFVNVFGVLDTAELRSIDMRASLTRHEVPDNITLIEIDEHSLQSLQHWPWPRRYHAELLNILSQAKAQSVFYDVDFSSVSNPVDDALLEGALSRFNKEAILLPAFVQPRSNLNVSELIAAIPLPRFRQHVTLVSVNLHPDKDGLVRRLSQGWKLDGQVIAPASNYLWADRTTPGKPIWIDYSIEPKSIARLSFVDVLEGNYSAELIRDRHIIVGATAVELGDMLPVPVYQSLPGAVVQGLSYLTIQHGALTILPRSVELLLALGLMVLMWLLFRQFQWRGGLVGTLTIGLALFLISLPLYQISRSIIPLAILIVQAVLSYTFFLMSRIEQQHLRILVQALTLRKKDVLMANVVNHSLDAILTVTDKLVIQSVNPSACVMLSMSEKRLVGCKLNEFFVEPVNIDSIVLRGKQSSELSAINNQGYVFPVEVSASRMAMDDDVLYTVFIKDITERVKQRQMLEYQATHDMLTGLANRYRLNDMLASRMQPDDPKSATIALLLLDLDRFKEINDSLGHSIGDRVLVDIAKRLKDCVHEKAEVSRLGGDEFAILMNENEQEADALRLAESLLTALEAPIIVNQLSLEVGASIGIACYPQHANDADALLQFADAAMYSAKRASTGVMVYSLDLTEKHVIRMNISTGLKQAMADAQLQMHYQPKVEMSSGNITGFEALLRWNHPTIGNIVPDEIVNVAENSELIRPLTEWTIKTSLGDAEQWHAQGFHYRVAVNLSARLLQMPDLIELLETWLQESAVSPRWLDLEITETAIMQHPERALRNANELKARGINLSIDDFGMGYSSLSYLKNLPASELKIDKSFVADMLTNPNDLSIVKSTIDLAHNLGLKVVAEGVENQTVLQALIEQGCDSTQGYYYARPMQLNQLLSWLHDWHNNGGLRRSN